MNPFSVVFVGLVVGFPFRPLKVEGLDGGLLCLQPEPNHGTSRVLASGPRHEPHVLSHADQAGLCLTRSAHSISLPGAAGQCPMAIVVGVPGGRGLQAKDELRFLWRHLPPRTAAVLGAKPERYTVFGMLRTLNDQAG